jgi:hypothetical protein
MNLFDRLRARRESRLQAQREATANAICRAIGTCPACNKSPVQHRYAPFAITVLTEERISFVRQFEQAFVAHEWATVRRFQDFDPVEDAGRVFAMACPVGPIVMLLMRDGADLWDGMSVHRADVLDDTEAAAVKTLVALDVWNLR